MHEAEPFAVAEEGNYGIEGVEDAVEGDAFVPVETGTHGIDQYPGYPLLKVFAGKHPHADYAQGRGKGIGNGDSAVGEIVEDQIQARPQSYENHYADNKHFPGYVCNWELF